MMSLFPGSYCAQAPEVSFIPLFRLLENFDNHSRGGPCAAAGRQQAARRPRSQLTTFKPRFDVRETDNTYELHGELPGLERENVSIEFPEPQTIVIRGRVGRSYGPESNNNSNNAAAESNGATEKPRRSSHQATVEDDPQDQNTPASTPAASPKTTEVSKLAAAADEQASNREAQDDTRYWLWERSVGEFSRAFTFPAHIDYDAVTASLSNGILSVTVPKAKTPAGKRIKISAL